MGNCAPISPCGQHVVHRRQLHTFVVAPNWQPSITPNAVCEVVSAANRAISWSVLQACRASANADTKTSNAELRKALYLTIFSDLVQNAVQCYRNNAEYANSLAELKAASACLGCGPTVVQTPQNLFVATVQTR